MSGLIYKGIAVTLNSSGRFEATVAGKTVTATSYASMRKQIDKLAAFEPFDAWAPGWHSFEKKRIVAIKTKAARSRFGRTLVQYEDSAGFEHSYVVKCSPENDAKVQAYKARAVEVKKLKEQLDEELRKLYRALPMSWAKDEVKS